MRKLLDVSSQRLISITEILLENDGWTTFASLGSAIGTSERTVAKDIAMLRERWGHHLNIKVSKKNGVRLINQNISSIGAVFKDIFNDSLSLQWIRELLFHPSMSMEFYESQLFTSRSTLLRILPKINLYLSGKGMKIICENNRYDFIGDDEQYLRDFSANFLLELYGFDLKKFDINLDLSILRDIILSLLFENVDSNEFSWISNDEILVVYHMMFYIVSLVREQNGYTVTSKYYSDINIRPEHLSHIKNNFQDIRIQNLNPIHEYITNQFNGWTSDEEKISVTDAISAFCDRFFSDVSFDPDHETIKNLNYILKNIYFNTKLRPFRTSELFDRIYYFFLSLSRENPKLYEVTHNCLVLFSEKVGLDVSGRVSDVLFWMCLICPELNDVKKHYRAALVSDFGSSHAGFLAETISAFFNGRSTDFLTIDVISFMDILTGKDLKSYDLLITTFPGISYAHEKSILINDYPGTDDFYTIYKTLQQRQL